MKKIEFIIFLALILTISLVKADMTIIVSGNDNKTFNVLPNSTITSSSLVVDPDTTEIILNGNNRDNQERLCSY